MDKHTSFGLARREALKTIGLFGGLLTAQRAHAYHTENHLDDTVAHRIAYQCNKSDPEYLQHVLFSAGELNIGHINGLFKVDLLAGFVE